MADRILWVDDDVSFCREMEEAFGGVYDITFCNDTSRAIEQLSHSSFKLIIVDLYWGANKKGIDLIEKIDITYPNISIITVSGVGLYKELDQSKNKGADHALSKSEFDAEEWKLLFSELLDSGKQGFIGFDEQNLVKNAKDENLDISLRLDYLNELIKHYGNSDQRDKLKAANESYSRLKELKNERRNIQTSNFIEQIEIENFLYFGECKWSLHPRLNILISENGLGKTTFLRMISALLSNDNVIFDNIFNHRGENGSATVTIRNNHDDEYKVSYSSDLFGIDSNLGRVPMLSIGDLRYLLGPITGNSDEDIDELDHSSFAFIRKKPEQNRFNTMLNRIILMYSHYKIENPQGTFTDLAVLRLIQNVLQNLLGEPFSFSKVTLENLNPIIEVVTPNDDRSVPIHYLSRGTNSVLYLFLCVYFHLENIQQERKSLGSNVQTPVCELNSIVIIDEIDAHLHPKWQQKILHILIENFPNIQFVVATHSPAVVRSYGDGSLSVLTSEEGKVYLSSFIGPASNLPFDDVYLKIFGMTEHYSEKFKQELPFKSIAKINEDIAGLEEERVRIISGLSNASRTVKERLNEINRKLLFLNTHILRSKMDSLEMTIAGKEEEINRLEYKIRKLSLENKV